MASFPGFPKDLLGFIKALSENNNREWFHANKDRYYASVVQPMCDFIMAMEPRMKKISPHFIVDPRPHGGSMFRIYRDVRFAKDKRPYKEHVACQFRHTASNDAHAPCFYVHISPAELVFGGGVWLPPSAALLKIRNAIADNPVAWKKIQNNKTLHKYTSGVEGDRLKRPPRGFAVDHPLLEDLKLKSFLAMHRSRPSLATKPDFIKEVEQTFKAIRPLISFLCDAVEVRY